KIQENIQRAKVERKFFSGIAPEYLEHNVALALQLHAEISGKNLLNEEQADAMLAQLVINYLRSVNTLKPDSVAAVDKVRALCKKIADNPLLELSLNDAAAKTGICRTGFTRAIKDITGMSFREFVNDCRLKHACKMLTEKDIPISDAAFASGFNNLGYFHRAFKNKFGKTPFVIKKIFRHNSFPQILNEYK
ncbi:MAG: AraC family transcriptional regulator, partial [Victivallaceae bacterium]